MPTREELIKQAEEKWSRDQLIKQAEKKWANENMPTSSSQSDELSFGQKAAQTLRSAAEGLTFGLSEPVVSGIMALEQNVKKSAQESSGLADFVRKASDIDRLKGEYSADVERRRAFERDEPALAMSGELVGALAPAALTGGTSLLARGAQTLPAAVTRGGQAIQTGVRAIPGAQTLMTSKGLVGGAARVGEAALVGGAQAIGSEAVKRAVQEPTGFIKEEDKLPSLGEIGLTGAKFGGTLASLPELVSQSARFGKFAARVFTGVRGKDIDYYMANQKAVQNAPSIETVKNQIDDTILKLNDDVDSAKLSVTQAKEAFKDAESNLKQAIQNNKNISAQEKANLSMSVAQAKREFDMAWKAKSDQIRTARVPIQTDDILDSVENVKRQVTELSEESYQLLDDFKGKFQIGDVPKQINQMQNQLKVGGKLLSRDSEAAFNVLQRWKDNLASQKILTGPQVKKVLQEIDSDLRLAGDRLAGEYSDKTYTALMGVRKTLDDKLKDVTKGGVPFYKEIMQDVSALNVLRGELSKTFGRRENVIAKLERINTPKLAREKELLSQLGELTGKDFKTPIDEFSSIKAQGATKIAQEQAMQSLPEYQTMQKSIAQKTQAGRPEVAQLKENLIKNKGPEAQAVRDAQNILDNSLSSLKIKKDALEPYKSLTPKQTENFVKELIGNPRNSIEKRKLAKSLGDLSEEDFLTMIDAMRTKAVFDREITQGSRNVNAWKALAGVVGFLSGGVETGLAGYGGGAFFGEIVDKYGPAMTRNILDGMLKVKANPTFQNINEAFSNVPPEIRDRLKSDLSRITTIYSNSSAIDRRMSDFEKR